MSFRSKTTGEEAIPNGSGTNTNIDTKRSEKLPKLEVYATIVAASSFLCIGLLRAYTSPALVSMRHESGLLNSTSIPEKQLISWIASSPPLASFFGTIVSGPLLQFCGRQKTIVILAFPYIIGWLLLGFANGIVMILIGRICTGFAAGLSTPASQVYVSECVRAKVRGTLGFLPAMMLALGVLIGFAGGSINVEWRELAFIMCTFPVILLVMSVTIPESPGWLLLRNRNEAALKSLTNLRAGSGISVENIQLELDELGAILANSKTNLNENGESEHPVKAFFSAISSKEIWLPATISVGLMIFQQFCGANCVIFYLTLILEETLPNHDNNEGIGTHLDPNIGALIVAGVQFIAFFVSLPLIDRLGRKVLLIVSALLMSISHSLMGFYFYLLKDVNSTLINDYGLSTWVPIFLLSSFIASYSWGYGPVPFLLMSEIFPSNARSYLCSLASFVNHFSLFITIYMFPTLLTTLGPCYTFWMFAIFAFCSIIFVLVLVPETKGKSLVQIELEFLGKSVTKL